MRRRISVHDLDFAGVTAGKVFGPLPVPTADELREALRAVAHRYPDHRLFAAIEPARLGPRWARRTPSALDQLCVDMVSVIEESAPDTDDLLDRVAQPLAPGQLARFWVGGGFIASIRSHVLGDTGFSYMLPTVLAIARGEPVPDLPDDDGIRLPLTRAALHWFGRHPERIVAALRTPRPELVGSSDQLVVPKDWRFTAVGRTASAETVDAVRAWRDANCPTASIANTWTALVRAALDDAGLDFLTGGLHMLVNARRYLPDGARVDSNFATSVYLEPRDPRDPAAVEEVVRRNLDSGRPLLAMAASGMKNVVSRRRDDGSGLLDVDRQPTLTVSYVGRRTLYEPLRADPTSVVHLSAARPDGPSGITVLCSLTHGRMSVSASFCEAVVPRRAVIDGLEALVTDPIATLSARGVGSARL